VISLVGTISGKSLKLLPSDVKAKMHQIRFRLGFCPRPLWRSLQRSPDPLAGFKGPTCNGKEGRGREKKGRGKGGEGKGLRGGKERGKGRERKGVREVEVEGEGVDIAWPDL